MTYEEILQLVKLFDSSSELSEFHLRFGDTTVNLRKHGTDTSAFGETSAPAGHDTPRAVPPPEMPEPMEPATPVAAPLAADALSAKAFLIKSPTVGTFYCASEPGATPFVSVGQRVTPTTTVCIVEVMKLMNAIQAGCSGVVSQILVKDAEMVEFGQTLIVVDQD